MRGKPAYETGQVSGITAKKSPYYATVQTRFIVSALAVEVNKMSQVIINIGDMFGSKSINLFPFAGLFKVFDEITFSDGTITFMKKDGTLIHIDGSSHYKGCIYLNGVRISCERVVIREGRADNGYWCVDFDIFTLLGDIITTSEYSDRKFRLY